MPNQSTHAPACLSLAAISVPVSLALGASLGQSVQIAAGCCLGVIVSPDLDMVNTLSRVPVIGWLWGCYWWGYRSALRHREWGSHVPGVSTIIRAIWLWPLWVGLAWLGLAPWWIIAGLGIADFGHSFMDAFWRTHGKNH